MSGSSNRGTQSLSKSNRVWSSHGRSYDTTVRVWDLETGQCLATVEGHTHYVWDVAIMPDGWRVISGSSDKTVRVWNLPREHRAVLPRAWFCSVSGDQCLHWGWLSGTARDDRTLHPLDGYCLDIVAAHLQGAQRRHCEAQGRGQSPVAYSRAEAATRHAVARRAVLPGRVARCGGAAGRTGRSVATGFWRLCAAAARTHQRLCCCCYSLRTRPHGRDRLHK